MNDKRFTSREKQSGDALDTMLREWHEQNRDAAEAGRERLLAKLRDERDETEVASRETASGDRVIVCNVNLNFNTIRRIIMHRYTRLAASLGIIAAIVAVLFPPMGSETYATDHFIMAPEGGRLDAFDERGNAIGPCPLKHADVDVQISGHFSRVTLRQQYHNPYEQKIEAVYSFPLSHRGAVDRMTGVVDNLLQQARDIWRKVLGEELAIRGDSVQSHVMCLLRRKGEAVRGRLQVEWKVKVSHSDGRQWLRTP
jgi:hypothetical protein